jgi:hypothetical protein
MMRGSGEADQRRGKNNATKIAKGMAGVCQASLEPRGT